MAIVECKHVTFGYDRQREILKDVSFAVEKGELLTLLGPNGVGKSTLLNCLTGLLRPQRGEVWLGGSRIETLSRRAIARKIAYVPQKNNAPYDYLVREFVVMGRTAHLGVLATPSAEDYAKAEAALGRLDVAHLADRPITELSGGEQQKFGIARALAQEPELVILDEPTAALDYGNQIKVLHLIRELLGLGFAVIQTTHNPDHCLMLRGRVAVLDRNGGLEAGDWAQIMTEERLSALYETKLRLIGIDEIGRQTCVSAERL